jgi:hypothetical protein
MDRGWLRKVLVWGACASACADASRGGDASSGSDEASGDGPGSTTSASSSTATSSAGSTSATTSATTSSTTADSGGQTTGELPDNCGWSGSAYACGYDGVDPGGMPIACPADLQPGAACTANEMPASCCDADGNALSCVCDGQACDYQWQRLDCAHAAGAGACGWWAEGGGYACGGDGADPNGTPMMCPDGQRPGTECFVDGEPLSPCCDASGDLWSCFVGRNGGPDVWGVTDC